MYTAGQSDEFALYLSEEEFVNSTGHLVCDTNDTILLVMCIIALLTTAASLFLHISMIKRRSQLRRLAPLLFSYILASLYFILRIPDPANIKLGQDITTTVIFAAHSVTSTVASVVYYSRFLAYQAKSTVDRFGVSDSKQRKFDVASMQRMMYSVLLLSIVSFISLLASAFTENYKIDAILLKIFLAVESTRVAFTIWANVYHVNLILGDIEQLYHAGKKVLAVNIAFWFSLGVLVVETLSVYYSLHRGIKNS